MHTSINQYQEKPGAFNKGPVELRTRQPRRNHCPHRQLPDASMEYREGIVRISNNKYRYNGKGMGNKFSQ